MNLLITKIALIIDGICSKHSNTMTQQLIDRQMLPNVFSFCFAKATWSVTKLQDYLPVTLPYFALIISTSPPFIQSISRYPPAQNCSEMRDKVSDRGNIENNSDKKD